jgi:hypothetical protein
MWNMWNATSESGRIIIAVSCAVILFNLTFYPLKLWWDTGEGLLAIKAFMILSGVVVALFVILFGDLFIFGG